MDLNILYSYLVKSVAMAKNNKNNILSRQMLANIISTDLSSVIYNKAIKNNLHLL